MVQVHQQQQMVRLAIRHNLDHLLTFLAVAAVDGLQVLEVMVVLAVAAVVRLVMLEVLELQDKVMQAELDTVQDFLAVAAVAVQQQ